MTSRERVETMVKRYPDNLAEIAKLEKEMQAFRPLTQEDVIEQLSFPGRREDSVRVQHATNPHKVHQVASSYRSLTYRLNDEARRELTQALGRYHREVVFVQAAIMRLPRRLREVMRALVLDDTGWARVCEQFAISGSTLSGLKNRSMQHMAEFLEAKVEDFGLEGRRNDTI